MLKTFNPQPPRRTTATWRTPRAWLASLSFNPQPPRRTTATACVSRSKRQCFELSILSCPEGRLRLDDIDDRHDTLAATKNFQSSAAPKDGCDAISCMSIPQVSAFQSSAAPKDGCDRTASTSAPWSRNFQSSAAPKDGCDLRLSRLSGTVRAYFQSSAAPKDGCDASLVTCNSRGRNFQSSAAPKDGCDVSEGVGDACALLSILSRPEGRLRLSTMGASTPSSAFNPQPPRRTAATVALTRGAAPPVSVFQSSAAPKDGCDLRVGAGCQAAEIAASGTPAVQLSILSRPEGRLRPRQFRSNPVFHASPCGSLAQKR